MEFNATFLVSVISFLVFVEIMNRIFYAPITKVVGKRQELLDTNYNEAKKFDDDAEGILKDREVRLGDADNKSRKIISERIEAENARGKSMTVEASKKSANSIQARKDELAQEKDAIQGELNSKIQGLAESIASKVMGMDVEITDSAQLNGVG